VVIVSQHDTRASGRAVIFDVDGVLIASPHERAWQDAMAVLMASEWKSIAPSSTYAPERFTTAVYQAHVAGKPRLDGATAILDYFGVPDAAQRAVTLGERKQAMIEGFIQRGEFEAFADGVRLVQALRAVGVRLGVASSSQNANQFMERVRVDGNQTLRDVFDANMCGQRVARGKPYPDIFLAAARALDMPAERCTVVEDAPSGIQAARAGKMQGLGVARLNDAALLEQAGANLVVSSLDLVNVHALVDGRLERTRQTAEAQRETRRRS
jgi:beta-phosphoglucomutase